MLVKMIHNWIPTYSVLFHQGRELSSLCPCCFKAVETYEHVFRGSFLLATINCGVYLHSFLSSLWTAGTSIYILSTMEYKLSLTHDISFKHTYRVTHETLQPIYWLLMTAICHQNIIGWDNFLQGCTSKFWLQNFLNSHENNISHPSHQWDKKVVEGSINLSRKIWADRNAHLHVSSKSEAAMKLRVWTLH